MKLSLAEIPTLRALYAAGQLNAAQPAAAKFPGSGALLDRVSL
jgi:hypothetical protein